MWRRRAAPAGSEALMIRRQIGEISSACMGQHQPFPGNIRIMSRSARDTPGLTREPVWKFRKRGMEATQLPKMLLNWPIDPHAD
jgi:hypothetical protein